MRLKNLSKLSLEEMQGLIGISFKRGKKRETITKVTESYNIFGDVDDYEIYTDEDEFGCHYSNGMFSLAQMDDVLLPQKYMDDLKQATALEERLNKENDNRIKLLADIPVKDRIKEDVVYHLSLNFVLSFDFGSYLTLKVGRDSGTVELRSLSAENRKIIAQLSDKEIAEFFTLYENFDFYTYTQKEECGFDGWSLYYIFHDEETLRYKDFWCPEKKDGVWVLVEYALNLMKAHLPNEEYIRQSESIKRYWHD